MIGRMRSYLSVLAPVGLALMLVACGGGGPLPTVPPPPVPPPPPPPTSAFDTLEFRQNVGLGEINALPAYDAGLDGTGVIVGVADTGIDMNNIEFAGRIHADSRNFIEIGQEPDDASGHGTSVSGIIAGAKNDIGTHGVAFQAQILALRVCGAVPGNGACGIPEIRPTDDNNSQTVWFIAALDHAIAVGARVVNVSLGFTDPDTPDAQHVQLLFEALGRAVDAGVLVVFAAGNDSFGDPQQPLIGSILGTAVEQGLLFVGAVGRDQSILGFSNRAGVGQDLFVVAPSGGLAVTIGGGFSSFSGTSASAPHVTGAAALLFQLFPNLTGIQVADILKTTALDLGAAGVDSIYGHGLIDLGAAIQPVGEQSMSGQTANGLVVTHALDLTMVQSGRAFGDSLARSEALDGLIMLDDFNRAYRVDLTQRITTIPSSIYLQGYLDVQERRLGTGQSIGRGSFLQFGAEDSLGRSRDLGALLPQAVRDTAKYRAPYFRLNNEIGESLEFSMAYGLGIDAVVGNRAIRFGNGEFYLSPGMGAHHFVGETNSRSAAMTYYGGSDTHFGTAVSLGDIHGYRLPGQVLGPDIKARVATIKAFAVRQLGPLEMALDGTLIAEHGSLLGSLSRGALGLGDGARTLMTGAIFTANLGAGLTLTGRYRSGWTKVKSEDGSLIRAAHGLRTESFAAQLSMRGLFGDDVLRLGVSSPLRVASGRANLVLPTSFDYDSEELGFSNFRIPLSPSGRELDLEVSYAILSRRGFSVQANLLHQLHEGHIRDRRATTFLLRAAAAF